jgi:predicted 2-oxoglutarate/Fe(II)-dependent dioxygenase YbiX
MNMNMEKLIELMNKIENPGTFSVGGQLSSLSPGLKVKGFGMVSLPIMPVQAQMLIQLGDQAPYGRGEDTLVDTQVRKVWQISAENFEISNAEWLEAFQKSIDKMGKQLGLEGCKINFEPYKLLVYEKDSFFISHRDTEKIPNMFATLVINLPSTHQGGDLIVSHGGESKTYSSENNDGLHPDFVVFYADCYHEVKPVTDGYRICLIYNLAIADRKQQPSLTQQVKLGEKVSQFIQQWKQDPQEKPILTYLLDHAYSEKNICMDNLKNGDFSKASVLLDAAEKSDCQAYLCLVTYYRSSYGDVSYGHNRYHKYDYDDDDADESSFEECDVSEEEIYANSFSTPKGENTTIEKISLEEEDLLARIPLLEGEGRECSISEATGNEGATKDLWYHRGAVIIWSPDDIFEVIEKTHGRYKAVFFKNCIQKNKLSAVNRKKIAQLASTIIDQLPREDISDELIVLGDIELFKKLLHRQMKGYGFENVDKHVFLKIADYCGWQTIEPEVQPYLTQQRDAIKWLNALLFLENLSGEGRAMVKKWTLALLQSSQETRSLPKDITTVIEMVALLNLDAHADAMMALLSEEKHPFFNLNIYGPALLKAMDHLRGHQYNAAIMNKFVAQACQWIKNDFPEAPKKPESQSREGRLKCSCSFCKQVNQFLPDAEKKEIIFHKTLKRNLMHIESEIANSGVDLAISIVKVAPSFDGICTKNQKSHNAKLQSYNAAQKMLQDLQTGMDAG